jgi:hypothetical protein
MKNIVVEMNKFDPDKFSILNGLIANCKIEDNGEYGFLGKAQCECGKVVCASLTVDVISSETANVIFTKHD